MGVKLRDNESFESLLRRFKRACEKAGTQAELRRRERFTKPSEERKRQLAAAVKRLRKKLSREGRPERGDFSRQAPKKNARGNNQNARYSRDKETS